eukprot:gene10701-2800_t
MSRKKCFLLVMVAEVMSSSYEDHGAFKASKYIHVSSTVHSSSTSNVSSFHFQHLAGRNSSTLKHLTPFVNISSIIQEAQASRTPIVALESTIISHGMPYPSNVETAIAVETCVREVGCLPATVGIIGGRLRVGLSEEEMHCLATSPDVIKTSRRDLAYVLSSKQLGATTVSGTMIAAHIANIPVFATGGLGGVHRGGHITMDISADITELSRTPVAVVCSGVKSILDIPRTLEALETAGVLVATIGEQREFPAFFAQKSECTSPYSMSEEDAAQCIHVQHQLGIETGIVFAVPIPQSHDIGSHVNEVIQEGLIVAQQKNVIGKDVTPFLLKFVNDATKGLSLSSNIELKHTRAVHTINPTHVLPTEHKFYSQENMDKIHESNIKNGTIVALVTVSSPSFDAVFFSDIIRSVNPAIAAHARPNKTRVIQHSTNYGSIAIQTGGVAYNMAVAAASFGATVKFATIVGEDIFGKIIVDNLNRHGIDMLLPPHQHISTAVYNAFIASDGNLMYAIADMTSLDALTGSIFSGNDHIQATLYSASVWFADCNCSTQFLQWLCDVAPQYHHLLWIEPTSTVKSARIAQLDIWKTDRNRHSRIVISPDVYEFNELVQCLKGETIPEISRLTTFYEIPSRTKEIYQSIDVIIAYLENKILKPHPNVTWVITLGRHGVIGPAPENDWFCAPTSYSHYPTEPLMDVRNVTGAGDRFAGTILAMILKGLSTGKSVQAGVSAARSLLLGTEHKDL